MDQQGRVRENVALRRPTGVRVCRFVSFRYRTHVSSLRIQCNHFGQRDRSRVTRLFLTAWSARTTDTNRVYRLLTQIDVVLLVNELAGSSVDQESLRAQQMDFDATVGSLLVHAV